MKVVKVYLRISAKGLTRRPESSGFFFGLLRSCVEVKIPDLLSAGVIAVVIFVMVAGLVVAARFLYRRKETYRNQEVKSVKQEEGPDFPFSSQAESQNPSEENPKEYFI